MTAETTKSPSGAVADIADILINGVDSPDIIDPEDIDDAAESDDSGADDTPTGELEEEGQAEVDEEEAQEAQQDDEDLTWGKALGIDDSKLVLDENGNLKAINVTIDGETTPVDMETLVNGFQFQARNTKVSQQLAEEKRSFEEIRDNAAKAYAQKLTEAKSITEYLGNQLMSEYQNIDWQGLRATDPAEYAARVQDYNLKQREIGQLYANINQRIEQEQAQQSEANQAQMQQFLAIQIDKLVQNHPEWSDSSKMRAAFDEMSEFALNTYGIKPEEFSNVVDSRQIEILRDAMAYRKGKQIGAQKIAKPLPKFVKSTGTTPKPMSKLDILTKAAKSSTGQANKRLSQAAIAELLINSL